MHDFISMVCTSLLCCVFLPINLYIIQSEYTHGPFTWWKKEEEAMRFKRMSTEPGSKVAGLRFRCGVSCISSLKLFSHQWDTSVHIPKCLWKRVELIHEKAFWKITVYNGCVCNERLRTHPINVQFNFFYCTKLQNFTS